mgnify:FL=1
MKRQLKNSLLITFGSIAFVFGILGVFLPLVPTTPLLLLAAACYVRSSQKLYRWLIHNKWFGQYIENFRSGQGIPLRAKVSGIVVLWLSIGITAVFVVPFYAVKIALVLMAAVVTWYILSFKTLKS